MIKIFDFKKDRLHGLDHLRALAIILVMVFHYRQGVPALLDPIRNIGWSGVDLFFVLSGYLIGHQLLKEIKNTNDISFRKFYLKRFFRIIPLYIFVLILYYSLQSYREGSGMPPLWKFLTFTLNIGYDTQQARSFSHAWSLCIEEQFYLLLPITIFILFLFKLQKKAVYFIGGLIIMEFVLRLYIWNQYVEPLVAIGETGRGFIEKLYYPSYTRMDGLLIGVSIAAIWNYKPKLTSTISAYGNYLLLIGISLFIVAYYVCDKFISYNTAIYGFPLVSFAFGFMVMAAISPSSILYKFKSKSTFVIATLSYAVYLSHKQIFHLIKTAAANHGLDANNAWVFWSCLIVAIFAGLILHVVIEKPFFRLRDYALNKENYSKVTLNAITVKSKEL